MSYCCTVFTCSSLLTKTLQAARDLGVTAHSISKTTGAWCVHSDGEQGTTANINIRIAGNGKVMENIYKCMYIYGKLSRRSTSRCTGFCRISGVRPVMSYKRRRKRSKNGRQDGKVSCPLHPPQARGIASEHADGSHPTLKS